MSGLFVCSPTTENQMKKTFAVIGVLFAFGMGLKLYNDAHEIKTLPTQPQQSEVAVVTNPAVNSSEMVTLEGKAKVTFPDRQ